MFQIGQQVAAKDNCPLGRFKKGDVKEILALQTCNCGRQVLDWGDNLPEGSNSTKCQCGRIHSGIGIWWSYTTSWSPIVSQFKKISYSEVLEQIEVCEN